MNLYNDTEAWRKLGLQPPQGQYPPFNGAAKIRRASWTRGAIACFDGEDRNQNPYSKYGENWARICWHDGYDDCHQRMLEVYEETFKKIQQSS